jgi:hypothetical protein
MKPGSSPSARESRSLKSRSWSRLARLILNSYY